jgi:hypothetical protein
MVGQPEVSASVMPRHAIGHDPEPALATYDDGVDRCMNHVNASIHNFVALPNWIQSKNDSPQNVCCICLFRITSTQLRIWIESYLWRSVLTSYPRPVSEIPDINNARGDQDMRQDFYLLVLHPVAYLSDSLWVASAIASAWFYSMQLGWSIENFECKDVG